MSSAQCLKAQGQSGKRCRQNSKPPLVVLQGQQPRHPTSTLSNRVLSGMYSPKGIAKEQGHSKGTRAWQKHPTKSLVKILSIKLKKMLGRYHSTKSCGINMLVFYAKKTFTSFKRTWQRNKQRAEKQHVASKSFRS